MFRVKVNLYLLNLAHSPVRTSVFFPTYFPFEPLRNVIKQGQQTDAHDQRPRPADTSPSRLERSTDRDVPVGSYKQDDPDGCRLGDSRKGPDVSLHRWKYGRRQESAFGGLMDSLERLNNEACGKVECVNGGKSL